MQKKNITIYKMVILAVLALAFTACGNSRATDIKHEGDKSETPIAKNDLHMEGKEEVVLTNPQVEALQLKIDTVNSRNMSAFVAANGQLEVPPQNEAIITSVVGANVVAIEVIEGDKVKKGQVVAYLSHPGIIQKQTDYLNAYNNHKFLKTEFERQKKLFDGGVASGMNFQRAEAEYKVAEAMVNGLEAQLFQLNISVGGLQKGKIYQRISLRSPIEGYVQEVAVKTGQYVDPQTALFQVVNTDHVHADLMVFEKDVHKVMEGQRVRFKVQSPDREELTATIFSISKTFEKEPKALHVHADIENKETLLIPGMYIKGRIETGNVKTLAFPEKAISREGSKFFVFSAEKEGEDWSFVPIEVALGENDGEWIAIKFMQPVQPSTLFVQNNAYYLMAEMKKGEAEHTH
ncbi:membrane fusion protein, cobalt-zinc-cadmium efflux system [Arenibacter nanhaiticus]|uniref:Membrane fusion protein, cobalt-zinc-cadmium efflux system n=1 Tax=Arenibacter nanhaiticus TaxID=558155 RepID=A0A1M6GZL0_9FLAO|nr:efflux RND transporter periplasmic adaptor subunit [Arenibacter nanhaiticus]SHJ15409.1 membrane fusion protein, cobalt-zinc-cadmium efflux system [Arenibacter nanhaiticus]